jgi:hypothetical protein
MVKKNNSSIQIKFSKSGPIKNAKFEKIYNEIFKNAKEASNATLAQIVYLIELSKRKIRLLHPL